MSKLKLASCFKWKRASSRVASSLPRTTSRGVRIFNSIQYCSVVQSPIKIPAFPEVIRFFFRILQRFSSALLESVPCFPESESRKKGDNRVCSRIPSRASTSILITIELAERNSQEPPPICSKMKRPCRCTEMFRLRRINPVTPLFAIRKRK